MGVDYLWVVILVDFDVLCACCAKQMMWFCDST